MIRGLAAICGMAVVVTLWSGCKSKEPVVEDDGTLMSGVEMGFGASQVTAMQIQSQVMGFADTFADRYAQAANELERSLEEISRRASIHSAKINNVLSAYSIAAGQSAITSLLDMVVFITLQRIIYEEVWQLQLPIGAAGDQMIIALYDSEREIWAIADLVLNEEQQHELHNLILAWRNANPTQNYVSRVRFSEFANLRTTAEPEADSGGGRMSLFSLLALDPLSSIDPAVRETRAARQSAERMAYFAKRLPFVMSWFPKQAAYDITASPRIDTLLTNVDEFGASADEFVAAVESWPEVIASEREALLAGADELIQIASETAAADLHAIVTAERDAAIQQLAEAVNEEREVTIDQMQQVLREEREAAQAWIDNEHTELESLVTEMRATLDSGTALANSSNTLLESYARLNPPSDDDAPPRTGPPTDYEAVLREAATTASELRQLTDSLRGALETEAATGEENAVTEVLERAQANMNSVVDRAFRNAMILLIIFLVGLPLALIIASRFRK